MRDQRSVGAGRYGAAVLLAAAAQAARIPLHPPTLIPSISYVPFMLIGAYLGGLGPGLLTAFLCTLESLCFATAPAGLLKAPDAQQWERLVGLLFTGVVASALFGRLKKAQTAAVAGEHERSGMAREIEMRQRMLESVIEHSPVSIALLRGDDFRFEMVNPAYQALAPGERMAGRTVTEVWPEAAPIILPLLETVRQTQRPYRATKLAVRLHRGPGQPADERYFDFTYVPLPAWGAAVRGVDRGQVLVVAIEVTDHQRAAADLRRTLEELESALAEKTVLLQEVHHRVKNNLAVIVSLLGMKASAIESPEAQAALEDSQQRVRSIALIHEHLYGKERFDRIDFAEYAGQLVRELSDVYGARARHIAIRVEAEPILMAMNRAVPCALILNELVTNALKHAFPDGRSGEIGISLRRQGPGRLELSIQDNGIGCPRGAPARDGKSLGLRIVEILTKQIEGSLEQTDGPGTCFVLRFHAGASRRTARSGKNEAGSPLP